jgi:hypothetical protein
MPNQAWVLMSIANEYEQPDKAFEYLWFHKPSKDEVEEQTVKGLTNDIYRSMLSGVQIRINHYEYWIEYFTEKEA